MTTTAEVSSKLPTTGDIAWVNFDPALDTEQTGTRPAVVVSAASLHLTTKRAFVCPVTSNMAPWPTKVILPVGLPTSGAVLLDQLRSVDRAARGFRVIGRVPDVTLAEIRSKLLALLGIDIKILSREQPST